MATPSALRRARERHQVRERILDAARELFVGQGYEALTMRRVAEAIEYTPPVIYQHFADKDALVREICLQAWRAFAHHFQSLAAVRDPIDRLGRMGALYVEFALTHPNHYRVMFMTPLPPDEPVEALAGPDPEARGRPELDAYAFLRAAVDEAHAAGAFAPDVDDPVAVAHALWLGVHGIVAMHITRPADHPGAWIEYRHPHAVARLQMRALMRGLTDCRAPE